MKARRIWRTVLLIIGCALVISLWPVHVVFEDWHNGDLYWRDSDAYVFVTSSQKGFRTTAIGFAEKMAKTLVGVMPRFEVNLPSTTILQIRADGVRVTRLPGWNFRTLHPVDGRLYDIPLEWQWTGDAFERVSDADRSRLSSLRTFPEFTTADGWSVDGWTSRCCLLSRNPGVTPFAVPLAGQQVALTVDVRDDVVAVSISRSSGSPERVLEMPKRLRWVSRREYDELFRLR